MFSVTTAVCFTNTSQLAIYISLCVFTSQHILDLQPASVKESSRGARLMVCESLAPRDYAHTARYSREGG